jgi:nucleoside-diphosphate-sugar epimerase
LGDREVNAFFHLAGGASVPDSVQNPYRDFSVSVPGTVRLLTYIAKYQPSARLVFFSSAAVYGNPGVLPIEETAEVAPISPYGIHKASSEFLLQHYARLYHLRTTVLRVFSAFGAGLKKQFFWDLSKFAFRAAALGEKCITLHGTGRESRDFLHAHDIAKAALCIAGRAGVPGHEVFNVGSGRETTIAEAASLLLRHLDIDVSVEFNGVQRTGEPLNWRADVTRLSAAGFRPETSLSEGIRTVATWLAAGRREC